MLLKVNITCTLHIPRLYCLPVLFTGKIRNLMQIIQPPGYSLWFHCIENIYANVIYIDAFFPNSDGDHYGTYWGQSGNKQAHHHSSAAVALALSSPGPS